MEICRSLGANITVARHLVKLLARDRFGDFLGDMVVAPVRETAAQALGVCLKHLPVPEAREMHDALFQMIMQSWASRSGVERWEKFAWELRHAGLLGFKYEIVVGSPDLGNIIQAAIVS